MLTDMPLICSMVCRNLVRRFVYWGALVHRNAARSAHKWFGLAWPVGMLAVHRLPRKVVEPGTAHDLQPFNQDSDNLSYCDPDHSRILPFSFIFQSYRKLFSYSAVYLAGRNMFLAEKFVLCNRNTCVYTGSGTKTPQHFSVVVYWPRNQIHTAVLNGRSQN